MVRKLSKDEINFYNRWINKANEYDLEKINDVCDKFFTLFVIFNYLYNCANDLYVYNYKGDKIKATKVPIKLLSEQAITNNRTINESVEVISKLIGAGVFYIRETTVDNRLLNQLAGNDLEKKRKQFWN